MTAVCKQLTVWPWIKEDIIFLLHAYISVLIEFLVNIPVLVPRTAVFLFAFVNLENNCCPHRTLN